LVNEIIGKASWCGYVAKLFPNDSRSERCSSKLNALAAYLYALPETHRLFNELAQIQRIEARSCERWLDEMQLEFSYLGYMFEGGEQQAVERLIEIADAGLEECQQAGGRR
jgi:hypothetical protein